MNRKIYLNLSLLSVSIELHLLALFLSFQLNDPLKMEEITPVFPMISAVVVETPAIEFVPPPPGIEPEILKEINEAVIPDEKAVEEKEEPLDETQAPISSEIDSDRNSEPSVQTPAIMDGRAVSVRMRFTIKFEI